MQLLIDTHVLLWWLLGAPQHSAAADRTLRSPQHEKIVSVASLWEIRIKQSIGKLTVPENFRAILSSEPLTILPVLADHADALGALPHHHRDPFDRMLIAQAQFEGLSLVTRDNRFDPYGISIVRV